jgi:type VI secretion system secreted protein VgrG
MTQSVGPVTVSSSMAGSTFEFLSMNGLEELSQPFRYDVEVLSLEGKRFGAEQWLGSTLTVVLTRRDGELRPFHGYVTGFSPRGMIGDDVIYAVTLRPWIHLLSHRVNARIFKGTAVEIVRAVFADYEGLQSLKVVTAGDPLPSYEFVVQYLESDLNFVMRVLERDGIYFYFTHEASLHTLVITDSEKLKVPGFDQITYHPPDPNAEQTLESIEDWQAHYEFTAGKWVTQDFNFLEANVDLEARALSAPKQLITELEVFDYPGGYTATGTGEKLSKRRLERLQVSGARFEGVTNARGVTAGQAFTLKEHPQSELDIEYLVYSVQFRIASHARQSELSIASHGDVMRASLTALDASRPFHPPQRTPKPKMTGLQTATVVGEKEDVDLGPNDFGEVKIRFHWDRALVEGSTSRETTGKNSCWVRVSQLWAGPSFGAVFHPRLGQEVLVDFLEGDPDRPIIVGRVHNSLNVPPYTSPTQSGIRSHSIPGGGLSNYNEIRFEDKSGAEEFFVQAEKTHTTVVKDDQSISVGTSRTLSVGGDESTTVNGTRTATVEKDETQTFHANRSMSVAGTNTDTVESAHTGNYNSGRTINVNTEDDTLNVSGVNRVVNVDGEYLTQTTKKYQLTHEENQLLLDTALAALTNGKCTLSFDGTAAVLSAADELRVECGSASITLTKDGTITITASQTVTVSGAQGAVELGPTGGKLSGLVCSVSGTTLSEVTGALVKIN